MDRIREAIKAVEPNEEQRRFEDRLWSVLLLLGFFLPGIFERKVRDVRDSDVDGEVVGGHPKRVDCRGGGGFGLLFLSEEFCLLGTKKLHTGDASRRIVREDSIRLGFFVRKILLNRVKELHTGVVTSCCGVAGATESVFVVPF
jgi:hypothetical protein